ASMASSGLRMSGRTGGKRSGAGRTGGGTGMGGGLFDAVVATPKLLTQLAALPPATDQPAVDEAQVRAADPQFSLRRLLAPLRTAFLLGIAFIGLDTVLQLLVPALIRTGIDRGVGDRHQGVLFAVSALALAVLLVDWLVSA